MDINSVTSTSSIYTVNATQVSQSKTNDVSSDAPMAPDISKMSDLMNKLKQLQESDPDKFKQVMSMVADSVRADAKDSNKNKAEFLNKLADIFEQASKSGEMPELRPPGFLRGKGHSRMHAHANQYANNSRPPPPHPGGGLEKVIESALQEINS